MPEGTSVVQLLLRDHKKAESLLEEIDSTTDEQLGTYFAKLREVLVRHEVAEEVVVYPAFRKNIEGADAVADSCIAEQSKAEEQLAALEHEGDRGSAFRSQLLELRQAVLAHAKHEETDVFPPLERGMGQSDLADLGRRYEEALSSAPTHAHPHAPDTPPGNTVLGPIAAAIDHVRDA